MEERKTLSMTEKGNPQTTYELAIIPTEEPKQERKGDSLACLEWLVGELIKQASSAPYKEKEPRISIICSDYYFPLKHGKIKND